MMEIPTNSQIILNQIVAKPSMDSWDALMDFISTETIKYISDKKKSYGLKLAAEEIISNILRASECKEGVIVKISTQKYTTTEFKSVFELVVADNGIHFNPEFDSLETPCPDIKISDRKIGGLGLFLVKSSCDSVKYIYEDLFNIYKLSVYLDKIEEIS